ncbi:type II toxin-antitoxin system death-on-curing family toxin [Microvirga tunisiensis]|uniref:Type II toxin-antitoxin system death-on-curing family toxin n=1 Tax=Microvirga tunisiensis TaxID=2108360 RepID=A0A5N7MRP1_9HYPH|nr:type II toxin-antitoxin system death-on-curing family toxin [Microvirga tunisiensis]MPR10701.1 type II toxin-antitoxin system death-on-curing family toxin [Microvirga tunisiensis]MPR28774.1 type II toxin-antitoxin system death-on-curing family toxin [Microvirga tunisiensis]
MAPTWILKSTVLALHDEQIAEHGGLPGIKDEGLLESALARPENLHAYGTPDIIELAAAYGFGIARNHAFVDGNKRTSMVVTELFLDLNGQELTATDAEVVRVWMALADSQSDMTEAKFTEWLREKVVEYQPTIVYPDDPRE